MTPTMRGWNIDVGLGGLLGGVIGAIVAVNLVIYSGIEDGYEASIPEVFSENLFVGLLTVGILCAGPVVGVIVARRQRSRRMRLDED